MVGVRVDPAHGLDAHKEKIMSAHAEMLAKYPDEAVEAAAYAEWKAKMESGDESLKGKNFIFIRGHKDGKPHCDMCEDCLRLLSEPKQASIFEMFAHVSIGLVMLVYLLIGLDILFS